MAEETENLARYTRCGHATEVQAALDRAEAKCKAQGLNMTSAVTSKGTPSPEVTVLFCLVPSPEFSQAPWDSLPAHLCRFGVRSLMT